MALVDTSSRRTAILTPLVPTACQRSSGGGYLAAVLADSPSAYWKLDETSGTTAADSSGNGHAGTYQGSLQLGQTPLITTGKALGAVGSIAGVLVANSFSIPTATSPFTVEAWIKTTATGTRPLVAARKSVGAGQIDLGILNGKLYIQPVDNSNGGLITLQSPGSVNDGATHHVVATRTSAKLWTLYIDAVSVASQADTMTTGATSFDLSYIGEEAVNTLYYVGTIDEVAVYPTALSAARILAHYTAGTT